MLNIFTWIWRLFLAGVIITWTIPAAIFSLQLIKPGQIVENSISFIGNIIVFMFLSWLLYRSIMRKRRYKRKHNITEEVYEEEELEYDIDQSQSQNDKKFNPNNGAF